MVPKTAYNWVTPSDVIGAGAVGMAGGLGARGVRHLIDLYRGKEDDTDFGTTPEAAVKVPVEVSPEEAQQLTAQGIHIRKKLAGFVGDVATGVGGAAGAYGGWKLLDTYLENRRRNRVKGELETTRNRVQHLLENNPLESDIPLHATMKAAEDLWFEKSGADWTIPNFAGAIGRTGLHAADSILGETGLGIPLGIFGSLAAMSAYNESRKNKYDQQSGAIRGYYEHQKEQVPQAELEPVVVEHKHHEAHPGEPKLAALGARIKGRLNGGSAR